MVALRVWLHDAKCTIIEAHARARAELQLVAARDQVEREAADLRARLEMDRAILRSQTRLTGMARRMANLTFDIEDARQLAVSKFRTHKAQVMADLQQLLNDGQHYTLRDLAEQLGVSYVTVRNYQRELAGLAAA